MGRSLRLEQARGRVLSLGQTWEVAAWEIERLGSCPLGKCTWENALGKMHLGKYTWGKAFGKVSNICSEHI